MLDIERFWRAATGKNMDVIRKIEGEGLHRKSAGADESLIELAETRIGRRLPASYRMFLSESNGLKPFSICQLDLWPCDKIDYFPKASTEWYEEVASGWPGGPKRVEELLQITPAGTGYILLLDPNEIQNQEWRAWRLGVQDEQEYQSFGEMFAALWRRSRS